MTFMNSKSIEDQIITIIKVVSLNSRKDNLKGNIPKTTIYTNYYHINF